MQIELSAYCPCLPCGWLWRSRLWKTAYLMHMKPCANLHGAQNRDFIAAARYTLFSLRPLLLSKLSYVAPKFILRCSHSSRNPSTSLHLMIHAYANVRTNCQVCNVKSKKITDESCTSSPPSNEYKFLLLAPIAYIYGTSHVRSYISWLDMSSPWLDKPVILRLGPLWLEDTLLFLSE